MRIEFVHTRDSDHLAHPGPPDPEATPVPAYVLGSLVTLAGAIVLVTGLGDARTAVLGTLIVLAGLVLVAAARQRARRPPALPEGQRCEQRWLITDDGVEITDDHTSTRATWAAFSRAAALPRAYVLAMRDRNDMRTVDIPREPLTAEDDAALRALFNRHDIRAIR